MENTEIAQWLRITGKRLIPMREFLDNIAEFFDRNEKIEKSASTEIAKRLQTIAEYVWLEKDESEMKGETSPDDKEIIAIISAMNELNPKLNIVQGDFSQTLQPTG